MIIYHFIAFSWTNLLTRCQVPVPVFLLFLSFRKVVQEKSPKKSTKNLGVLIIDGEGVRQTSPGGGLPGGTRVPGTGPPLAAPVALKHPLVSPFRLQILPD